MYIIKPTLFHSCEDEYCTMFGDEGRMWISWNLKRA